MKFFLIRFSFSLSIHFFSQNINHQDFLQALLRKYNNYIKDLEKKLKEKELEQKPEAIEEMQRLLQEKDLKINELKEQLVVSSCSQTAVPRPDDLSVSIFTISITSKLPNQIRFNV